MKTIILLIIFSTSLCAQDFVFDKEKGRAVPSYIGQVKHFVGKALIIKNNKKEDLKHGDRFGLKDVIETQEKSVVKIQMIDDTMITVGPKSQMEFSDFEFRDKSDRSSIYTLIKGQMTSEVKNKAKKDGDLKYRTKHATMGVRGTRLLLNFQSLGEKGITQMALTDGKALVEESTGTQKHNLVKGDHVVIVNDSVKNIAASEKFVLTDEEVDQLSGKGLDQEKDVRPLLPFFDMGKIAMNSPLYPFTDKVIEVQKSSNPEEPRLKLKKKDKNWKQNLDKLNEQLKENQDESP